MYNGGGILDVSRDTIHPYWDRADILAGVEYDHIRGCHWESMSATYLTHQMTEMGSVEIVPTEKNVPIAPKPKTLAFYDTLKVFTVLFQLQTMTVSQLIGLTSLAPDRVMTALNTLYEYGIVTRLSEHKMSGYTGPIYHLVDNTEIFWDMVDSLPSFTRVALMGGLNRDTYITPPGGNSIASVRHNLIGTDLFLRALEASSNIIGYWGEPFMAVDMLAEGYTDTSGDARANHGDGALITGDGKLVVFELVGGQLTSQSEFERIMGKAAGWTAATGASVHDISVVFVNLADPRNYSRLVSAVTKGVNNLAWRYGSQIQVSTGQPNIFTVHAGSWFPYVGCVSKAFLSLTAFNIYLSRHFPASMAKFNKSTVQRRLDLVTNTLFSPALPVWRTADRLDRLTGESREQELQALYDEACRKGIEDRTVRNTFTSDGEVFRLVAPRTRD